MPGRCTHRQKTGLTSFTFPVGPWKTKILHQYYLFMHVPPGLTVRIPGPGSEFRSTQDSATDAEVSTGLRSCSSLPVSLPEGVSSLRTLLSGSILCENCVTISRPHQSETGSRGPGVGSTPLNDAYENEQYLHFRGRWKVWPGGPRNSLLRWPKGGSGGKVWWFIFDVLWRNDSQPRIHYECSFDLCNSFPGCMNGCDF